MVEPVYSHHTEEKRGARPPPRAIRQEKAKIKFTCWLRNTGALVQKSMASRWRPQDYEGEGYQYLLIHVSVYTERNLIKRLLDSFFQSY